jgi:CheY-like chemotaxis protein
MSRVLLADDSAHAQRMGELILRDEGFEVVTVTDGETALLRLADVNPDVLVVDAHLTGRSGYQLCEAVKTDPRFPHTRVVLTAGAHEAVDEAESRRVGADAVLRRPFEASVMIATLRPLAAEAEEVRQGGALRGPRPEPAPEPTPAAPPVPGPPDEETVRAAVTLALDAAMPELIDTITEKVLFALTRRARPGG